MMINEVKSLLGDRDCSIAHISRCQNTVSHRLATFGRVEARTAVWLRSGPANVSELCLFGGASSSFFLKVKHPLYLLVIMVTSSIRKFTISFIGSSNQSLVSENLATLATS